MLFYVQMKWNYQGRLSQDGLWDLEAQEGVHALQGVDSGMVKGIYKVVSQHRIIAIVDVDSLENLDRNSMGWLPMREYLEFEQVWALRDYPGFLEDVRAKFPTPGNTSAPASPLSTTQVAKAWFDNMQSGNFNEAIKLLDDDVTWDNIPPTPGVSDVAPWLGSYKGVEAVLASFDVWAAHSKMLGFTLLDFVADGEKAVGVVHEHGMCLKNRKEYDLYVSTHLTIRNGKIAAWKVYWDPSPLIRAYM